MSSRADLWPLTPVVEALARVDGAHLQVVIGGALSDPEAGDVDRLALLPGAVSIIRSSARDDAPLSIASAVARLSTGLAEWLADHRPDLLVVLGDRHELLGVAAAAVVHRIPLAHVHGGEITEGAFDDSVRHAISKLAHLHLAATEGAASRLRALGEEPWRIHVTGAPSLDRLVALARSVSLDAVLSDLGVRLQRPVALLTYHPPTLCPERAEQELDACLAATTRIPTVIATHPGLDPGSAAIVERLRVWKHQRPGAVVVKSLGERYPAVMAGVDLMIGNSSSGIIEAATFGLPVVNVGDRQRGRERATGVLDVAGEQRQVSDAVRKALTPSFRAQASEGGNPYGDGKSGPRIAEVLTTQPLTGILRKRFVDPEDR
jgi:UDP-N-acetylglucosamine 2-epimerase (non-hydrolysing)